MPEGPADTSADWADTLLALSLARPQAALAAARSVLAGSPDAVQASVAHQAIGIVLRDYGAIGHAVDELRSAHRWARRSGDPDRVTDVRGSLGVALVMAGSTRAGAAALDAAVAGSSGVRLGRMLVRRSNALWVLGRGLEALHDARRSVALLAGSGDPVWEVRALHHRAAAHLGVGAVEAADRDYARCEELHELIGQDVERANVRHERGIVAYARGDLPAALTRLHEAEQMFDDLAVFEPQLIVNRCTVLLAAGLVADAQQEMDKAVVQIEAQQGSATRRAELLFGAALAAYAAGDRPAAERYNGDALRLFRHQQRRWWTARAELLGVQSRASVDSTDPASVLPRARRIATTLDGLRSDRAVDARLLAGQLALAAGRRREAHRHLQRAATARHGSISESTAGWLAQATLCQDAGRSRAMLAACERGLSVLDLHLRTLGATELRTLATARGTELAGFALRHAAGRGDARRLLEWSERWRAVVLAVPPVNPPHDSDSASELAALRHIGIRLAEISAGSPGAEALQAERRRLESAVRRRVLQTPGEATVAAERFTCTSLLDHAGSTDLIELVEVDGELIAVVATNGRVRMEHVGPMGQAEESLAHARSALRRAARRTGRAQNMEAVGAHLEKRILGGAGSRLGGDLLVVVPPGRLHAVPWGLLPSLRDRPTTAAPSASAWLRARRAVPPVDGRVVLVGGPRLATGADEVQVLARQYPDAVVLTGEQATVENALAAMDGATLVHVAAHGTFRADSPQFSAIELHDGPLTVYDLERLRRAPHHVILANCDSGMRAPAGADELLGLVSALIALGSAGVIASVVPVSDEASVPLMLDLHRHIQKGLALPESLTLAQGSAPADQADVAASFIALGC